MVEVFNSRNGTADSSQAPSPMPIWQQKSTERARQLWAILRKSVKLSTDLVKKADVQPSTIRHGVHHTRKINHDEAIIDVVFNPTMEEYVTVDNQFIRVFYKDGRRKDIIDCGEKINKLIVCFHSNQYAAIAATDGIKLFNHEFELISVAKSQHKIHCLIYNESTNEIVTAGSGNVMTWCFRYGNRYLIPHRTITNGLTCKDVFNLIALENTESNTQRCYVVCGTSVAVVNLFQAKLLVYKRDLHVRNITSILFFNPLKFIVTGSRDGSIKLWDENFGIRLVFVGHHGPISSLNLYPQGPYIMSASHDSSIRLWSLETCDEVDLITMDEPVLGLGTTPKDSSLFSFSKYSVDLWEISHVHQIFTTVGNPVQKLQATSHNNRLASRVVCQSEDGTIRLISPVDGVVLTTIVPPDGDINKSTAESPISRELSRTSSRDDRRLLVDAVYCLPLEVVFAAYGDGTLIKASTITNPAKIKKKWKFENGLQINCICLYEYILNITELKKTWQDVKSGINVMKRKTKFAEYGNKMILLVGRKDGYIASIDMMNGQILFKTEAHGAKGVIGLLPNVRDDQVISAGRDNVVKVWRIFPNMRESLSLLMSFYCAHTPLHMSIAGSRLAVAFQQLATATYTIVMYDLESKERFDHSPKLDHTDELTGLACCPRLKLFASASNDGTVKIWNDDNGLVRILKLNEEPKSLEFCDQRGDLLVGLGRNIHQVEHTSYIPRIYLFKMVCMEFPNQIKEDPIPLNEELLRELNPEVALKVTSAKSSYMRMDYAWDPMTSEEQENLTEVERDRIGAYSLLSARDEELARIRDGTLKPKRANRRHNKRTESIAFKKYMALFFDRPKKLNVPDEDDFDPDPPFVREPTPERWVQEQKIGFFPPIHAAKPVKDILEGLEKEKHLKESGPDYNPDKKYIINPSGFIPNSILIKLLWPQDEVKKMAEEIWKPPTLSEEQLEIMRQMEKTARQGIKSPSEEDEEAFMMESESDWEDEERVIDFEDEKTETSVKPSAGATKQSSQRRKQKIEKKPSALMEKMRLAMATPPPPPKEPTPPTTPPPPEAPKINVPTRPTKPIVKFVSRPPPPKDPTPPPPTPPPPTPPPPTPPPIYLTQFEGLPWFDRHKDYIMQRMKKPITSLHFFNVICDVMGISIDWNHRCGIVNALLLLWQQEGINSMRHLVAAIGSILNASAPPNPKEAEQAAFLRAAVKLYQTVSGSSEDFLTELLTEYLEGDLGHRSYLRNILIEQGLQDPHSFLSKELESWEIWNVDDTRPVKPQIKEMVQRWYNDWNMRFQNHIDQTLDQLRKGDIRGRMRRPGLSKTAEGGKRVQFTIPANEGGSRTISPIEVVNYYCEIKLEEELDRVRLANIKPEPTKNTVLVLPKLEGKQAIVRLGEMHTAQRVRHRRELAAEYKLNPLLRPYPDLMAAFTNKLNLPVSKVHMNPFPSQIDRFDENTNLYQPILLTLRSSAHQKYFVPEKSYVHIV